MSDLANRFEISEADLYKDLMLLFCCGLPGQTPLELMDFSFEDGFVSVRNADELRRPRAFTQVELASLALGLQLLAAQGHDAANSLASRLKIKLKSEVLFQPSENEIFVKEIQEAIEGGKVLSLRYSDKEREVIPFQIYSRNGFNYLQGYCKLAQARRTFKLVKIDNLRILDKQELPPNEVPNNQESFSTPIKVHRNPRLVREIFGSTEVIEYFSEDWLISEVIALGGAVELLEPTLRAKLRARVMAGQNLYLG